MMNEALLDFNPFRVVRPLINNPNRRPGVREKESRMVTGFLTGVSAIYEGSDSGSWRQSCRSHHLDTRLPVRSAYPFETRRVEFDKVDAAPVAL